MIHSLNLKQLKTTTKFVIVVKLKVSSTCRSFNAVIYVLMSTDDYLESVLKIKLVHEIFGFVLDDKVKFSCFLLQFLISSFSN